MPGTLEEKLANPGTNLGFVSLLYVLVYETPRGHMKICGTNWPLLTLLYREFIKAMTLTDAAVERANRRNSGNFPYKTRKISSYLGMKF
jgi:hypothetical protein